MHLAIAGKLGSGKSTICNILNARHGFKIYSTGLVQREIAVKKNISILEMNLLMSNDVSFDHLVDDAVRNISIEKSNETIIFDSRMAWNFAENSFKIFVVVDPFVAAVRVINDPREAEEVYRDVEDARFQLVERARLENERFKEIYNVNNFDYKNYHLVIDSSFAAPEEVASIIYEHFERYTKAKQNEHIMLISPKSLYPLESIRNINDDVVNEYKKTKKYLVDPISIIQFEGYHYVADGHHRMLAALLNNENFVQAEIAQTDNYPFYATTDNLMAQLKSVGISTVYDFEAYGEFRYCSYPGCYSEDFI